MDQQTLSDLEIKIASELAELGKDTPYVADANEPDPRYLGYGVRAPAMRTYLAGLKPALASLPIESKVDLAQKLIQSGYGEQKNVALFLLEDASNYFAPNNFDLLEAIFLGLHGWSKIDGFTKQFLPAILSQHPEPVLDLVGQWNNSSDLWLRRASVVLFTRKLAKDPNLKDIALAHCQNLLHDPEHLVQTGVGWCLRDLMRSHKTEVLDFVTALRRQGVTSKITLYALRDIKGSERDRALAVRPKKG